MGCKKVQQFNALNCFCVFLVESLGIVMSSLVPPKYVLPKDTYLIGYLEAPRGLSRRVPSTYVP